MARFLSVVRREITRHTCPDGVHHCAEVGRAAHAAGYHPKKLLLSDKGLFIIGGVGVLGGVGRGVAG